MNYPERTKVDPILTKELRNMARRGAPTAKLVERICGDLGITEDMYVPIFACLLHVFRVPLKTLLPLQEGFSGSYSRVTDVAFCFTAQLLGEGVQTTDWNWERFRKDFPNFDLADLKVTLNEPDRSQIAYSLKEASPSALYVRGYHSEGVDKQQVFDGASDRPKKMHAFTAEYLNTIREICKTHKFLQIDPLSICFDFQVHDHGPMFKVVCLVQAWADVTTQQKAVVLIHKY